MTNNHTENILFAIESALAADRPVRSVFKNISLEKAECKGQGATAKVLTLEHIAAPANETTASVSEKYQTDKIKLNEVTDPAARAESAFFLLQKYGSRLLKADATDSEIPLFDDYRIDRITQDASDFILLKGDFTGIQDFIYGDIKTDQIGDMKRVSKELRGKSFFVSMLTDLIAEQYLNALGLSEAHLLFAGGGHFNILVPGKDISPAEDLAHKINQTLPNGLHFLLAHTEVTDLIKDEEAGKAFDKINSLRDRKKYNAFEDNLQEVFAKKHRTGADKAYFSGIGGLLPKTDYILQIRGNKGQLAKAENFKEIYSLNLFGYTESLISFTPFLRLDETLETASAAAAVNAYLDAQTELHSVKILRLNNTDFLDIARHIRATDYPVSYAFRFVGNYAPLAKDRKEEDNKDIGYAYNYLADFTQLSETPPDAYWKENLHLSSEQIEKPRNKFYSKLAYLRLDIDDLGAIFSIGQKNSSLKHTVVLSRELNLFFTGHINVLAEKHNCYVVYSGGDDAFVVGSWLNAIFFIKELQEDFCRFTAENTEVNLSAGIFTCNHHYPIAKAAKEAGALEQRAKTETKAAIDENRTIIKSSKEKNSICVFNQTLSFGNFSAMIDLGEMMIKHTSDKDGEVKKKLSKSLVYKILGLLRHSFDTVTVKDRNGNVSERKVMNAYKLNLNRARIFNLFARHGFDEKHNQKAVDDLTNKIIMVILHNFSEGNHFALQDYSVALNYVLFNIRKPNKKNY